VEAVIARVVAAAARGAGWLSDAPSKCSALLALDSAQNIGARRELGRAGVVCRAAVQVVPVQVVLLK
jgi:hypothetical protein